MYTVQMEKECGCFRKSEFKSEKTFENQNDAYNYAQIASEIMNEDFCGKHHFFVQKIGDYSYMIRVGENVGGSSCSSGGGSCGTSCGC